MKDLIQALTLLKTNMESTSEHVSLIERTSGVEEWLKPNLATISETLTSSGSLIATLIEFCRKYDKDIKLLEKEFETFSKFAVENNITQEYQKFRNKQAKA